VRRGKLILLLGISGAGKTTTGLAVARATPVTYLYAVTEKLELVRPGETLNLLDQARTYEVNGQFFAKVLTQPGALLVDTHATYPVGGAFVNLTPAGACPGIGGMVFLEADPATIRARRLARGRASEATELGMIEREAVAERAEVERLSRLGGIPTCRIDTAAVPLEEAVRLAIAFVESVDWQTR